MTKSLNNRLSVMLALMLTASGVASLLILKFAIVPAFNALESDAAVTDLDRAALAIDMQLQQLTAIAGDWAPWDEPYAFAMGENPDFVWRNIDLSTLRNIELELMQYYDVNGQLLWSGYMDDGRFASLDSLGILSGDDALYDTVARHDGPSIVVSGLMMTARGPMLIVSMPLVKEAGVGPVAGAIVIGRILTDTRLGRLQNQIRVPFEIVTMQEAAMRLPSVTRQLGSTTAGTAIHSVDDTMIRSYRLLTDISGGPLGILVARTSREVTALGQDAANLALQLFVAMALVLLGLTWLIIRKDIVGRLERLAEYMTQIRRSGDLSARIVPDRDDEIGRLGQSFNALTGELQQARRELVEQSFQAGRADTAADVLHNVRNAMTPVINVAESLTDTLQEITTLRLARAAEELTDPACPDERRNTLLQYMSAAADKISAAGSDATQDVNLIHRQALLVEDILSGQEKVARFEPLRERINLAELVSEATAILPVNHEVDIDLQTSPELSEFFVLANRVHLLQILGNVMLNAYESVKRGGGQCARIDVNVTSAPGGHPDVVELSIGDNGEGLEQEHAAQLFQRGFTSKSSPGHGLGLHWCANAVGRSAAALTSKAQAPARGPSCTSGCPQPRPSTACPGAPASRGVQNSGHR